MEKIEEIIQEYEKYTKENGFQLNPDRKIVESVVKALIKREEKFGRRYCPCRRVTGNEKEDKKIICPCIYHKEEIEREGHCLCNLFVKLNTTNIRK